jgi:hypothetical protein
MNARKTILLGVVVGIITGALTIVVLSLVKEFGYDRVIRERQGCCSTPPQSDAPTPSSPQN